MRRLVLAALLLCCASAAPVVNAQNTAPAATRGIGVEENLGAQLPLDLRFTDQNGVPVSLGQVLGRGRPAVLVLGYYRCEMLCPLVLRTAVGAVQEHGALGTGFDAVTVSVDPRDTPADARRMRAEVLRPLGTRAAAWPFLVATPQASRILADQLGFRYRWDPTTRQYAHAAAFFVIGPDGRISRYLYGLQLSPEQFSASLREAARGRAGPSWSRVLTLCYHYMPALRRHAGLVRGVLRGGALLILFGSALLVWMLGRRVAREASTA